MGLPFLFQPNVPCLLISETYSSDCLLLRVILFFLHAIVYSTISRFESDAFLVQNLALLWLALRHGCTREQGNNLPLLLSTANTSALQ